MPVSNHPVLDALDQISAEPGKLEKRRLMQEHDSPELRKLLVMATSPYITFGVQQLPPIEGGTRSPGPELEGFFELARKLSTRELSGNAAKQAIQDFWSCCSPKERLYFGGVLTKKLRCGVDTAVNDVWPGSIPEFKPQLAEDWAKTMAKPKAASKYDVWPKLQSRKLDGMRALGMWIEDIQSFGLFSREGRPIPGMPHIIEALNKHGRRDWVYDGELYSHQVVTLKGFPYMIGLFKRQTWDLSELSGKDLEKVRSATPYRDMVEYHIFDRVSVQDWNTFTNNEPLSYRLNDLCYHLEPTHLDTPLKYVVHNYVGDLGLAVEFNGGYLEEGYEGSMLKDPSSTYEFKRSASWLKYKLFITEEYEITGTYMGESGSKWDNSLGGFNCKTTDGKPFKAGGGRCDMETRTHLWETRDQHVGKLLTVRFFEVTPEGVPRFPVFTSIRDYE